MIGIFVDEINGLIDENGVRIALPGGAGIIGERDDHDECVSIIEKFKQLNPDRDFWLESV